MDKAIKIPITTRTISPIAYLKYFPVLFFFHKVVSYFSKEFYHWLAVYHNEAQRRYINSLLIKLFDMTVVKLGEKMRIPIAIGTSENNK